MTNNKSDKPSTLQAPRSAAPGQQSDAPVPMRRDTNRARLVTTTPGKSIAWAVLRKYQDTGRPHTYDTLRFTCDRCGWTDSLEVAERNIVQTSGVLGERPRKHSQQLCTACKHTTHTVNRRPAEKPTAAPKRITTTHTVKTEE